MGISEKDRGHFTAAALFSERQISCRDLSLTNLPMYCVVQSLALGIDRFKETLVTLQSRRSAGRRRHDHPRRLRAQRCQRARKRRYGEAYKGFIGEEFDTNVEIVENGVHYMVDVKDGQKTGFFLDQKYNRLAIQQLWRKAQKVLDCFTHTGSFALNAGLAGAKEVLGVDASELGVHQAETKRGP